MRELPRVNIYDDFYIWFDLEEKKEHYATPLYLYNVKKEILRRKNLKNKKKNVEK